MFVSTIVRFLSTYFLYTTKSAFEKKYNLALEYFDAVIELQSSIKSTIYNFHDDRSIVRDIVKCKNQLQRIFVLNSKIRFFYSGDEINKMTNDIAYSNNLIILALEFKNRPVIGSKETRNALENSYLEIPKLLSKCLKF